MKTASERLIKDPFFSDLSFIDFEPVLNDINKYRRNNGLYTEVEENELEFDKQEYIYDYAEKIGANKPHISPNGSELWYYATLETIAYLKANGCVWEWDSLFDSEYITNDYELCNKVYEDDLINQANELSSAITEQVWKYGGRCLGVNFMEVATVDFDGEVAKFWIDTNKNIVFKPGFEPSAKTVDLLNKIKKEAE